jgi:hypothetical protein
MNQTINYSVVILTADHSFSGELSLRDQRLSDFLNNRQNTFIVLRKVSVSRLSDPSRVLEQDSHAVIAKNAVLIAFEPPQQSIQAAHRLYAHVAKEKTDVFIALEGMEVRGVFHSTGPLELDRIIATPGEPFIALTHATVTLQANPRFVIQQDAVMVNVHEIRYVGKVGSTVIPRNPPPPPREK